MNRGTIFEHRYWMDTKNMPLLCIVTAIRAGGVCWAIWQAGEPHPKGKYWFSFADTDKHVKSIIQRAAQ